MDKMRSNDTPSRQAPVEASPEVGAWTQIESINPEILTLKLQEQFASGQLRHLKQSERNRDTVTIRIQAAQRDLVGIRQRMTEHKDKMATILEEVEKKSIQLVKLEMDIKAAQRKLQDTTPMENDKTTLLGELDKLQSRYGAHDEAIDELINDEKVQNALLATQQGYAAAEQKSWEIVDRHKEVMLELANVAARLSALPTVPLPIAPPDMDMQRVADSLPLSIDGNVEEKRQILTIDIQQQIALAHEAGEIDEVADFEAEDSPNKLSYQELADILPRTRIVISEKQLARLINVIPEDVKA